MRSWSVSRSWLWHTCRFWYLLQHDLHIAPAIAEHRDRAFGTLVHKGIQAAFLARRDAQPGATTMSAYVDAAIEAIDGEVVSSVVRSDAVRAVARLLDVLPAPHPAAILAVELPFEVEIEGVIARGVIDYAIRTGPTSLHIRDWKTGKVETRADHLERNMQLALYKAVAHVLWPWATTITVGLMSVNDRVETMRDLSAETVAFFAQRFAQDAHESMEARAAVTASNVALTHPTTTGEHCSRCPFRPYCPEFAGAAFATRAEVDIPSEGDRIRAALARRA